MRGTLMDLTHLPPEFLPEEQWSVFGYEEATFPGCSVRRSPSTGGRPQCHHRPHLRRDHSGDGRSRPTGPTGTWWPTCSGRCHCVAGSPKSSPPVCHQLLDEVAGDGCADLVQSLTYEFPTRVIASILGLPGRRSGDVSCTVDPADRHRRRNGVGIRRLAEVRDYFQGLIEQRRSTPPTTSSVTWWPQRSKVSG